MKKCLENSITNTAYPLKYHSPLTEYYYYTVEPEHLEPQNHEIKIGTKIRLKIIK